MRKYKTLEVAVHPEPDKQISLTDPDARSMATSGKDTGMVGYNPGRAEPRPKNRRAAKAAEAYWRTAGGERHHCGEEPHLPSHLAI